MLALLAGAAVLVVAALPVLWQWMRGVPAAAPPAEAGAPWQTAVRGDGSVEALGIVVGRTTLREVQARQAGGTAELQVALVAPRSGAAGLEGHVERFVAGGVAGRLVLGVASDAGLHEGWRLRAARSDPGAAAVRHTLSAADAAVALQGVVESLTFVAAARLDDATLLQRFGEPAQRLRSPDGMVHWLYPARGVSLAVDPEGRTVVQWVAPAAFESRLQAPLVAAGASAVAR